MPAKKYTLLAMLAASTAGAQSVSPAAAAPASPPLAYCIEGPGPGRITTVPMTEYTVALLADSIEPTDPRVVNAKATLLFKYSGAVYPWVDVRDGRYPDRIYVQCKDPLDQRDVAAMPNVIMQVPDPSQSAELVHYLGSPQNQAYYKQATVPSWPAFLPFYKGTGGYVPVPSHLASPEALLRGYFNRRVADPAFLAGFPYKVTLQAPGKRYDYIGAALPAGQQTANNLGAAAQQPPAQQTPAPAQTARAGAGGRGRPQPSPQPAPQNLANSADALKPVNQTPTIVTFRFSADQGQWRTLIQNKPDLIDTFGYCIDAPVQSEPGVYKQQCTLRPDHKLPIRIAGFEELLIEPDGPALDEQLKVIGYKYPYPTTWPRTSTDFVSVNPGRLKSVLASHITLSQGTRECELDITPTIENIVSGKLTIPPQAPCRTYDVSFRLPLAPDAAITEGCFPGARVPIGNAPVTCWAPSAQAGKVHLKAHLLQGFSDVNLDVPAADTEVGYALVLPLLAPLWPYDPNLLEAGDARTYKPESLRLVGANGSVCEASVPPPINGGYQLPTLAQMNCQDIPRQMSVTFRQDGEVQGAAPANSPDAPPSLAFQNPYVDTVDLASVRQGRKIALESLKLPLPVRFVPDDARAFDSLYGEAARNLQFPGVFVFEGDTCTGKSRGKFVRFKGPATTSVEPFKWPVRAASYDAGEAPLTQCSRATVAQDAAGPYLTFDLKGARAAGPRRVIVISESQKVLDGGGSIAITKALQQFVDNISQAANVNRAPLSPINVFFAGSTGDLKPLFSGEKAAIEPQGVKTLIGQPQERTDQTTPNFGLLHYTPELKDASGENFDHVIFVMDGSDISHENTDVLAGLTNRIGSPDAVSLLITANNCGAWKQSNPNLNCVQLPPDVGRRTGMLVDAFSRLILPSPVQAGNEPSEAQPVPPATRTNPRR